jgi:hypothetical protein
MKGFILDISTPMAYNDVEALAGMVILETTIFTR